MEHIDRGTLLLALVEHKSNLTMAAHVLGVTPDWVREECARHNIDPHRLPGIAEAKAAFTHDYLVGVMRACNGIVSTAAVVAGVTQQAMSDYLRRYDIDAKSYRWPEPEVRTDRPVSPDRYGRVK